MVKRVVGILTEAGEIRRLLEENVDRDDVETDSSVVTALLNETMPRITIPEDASIEEVAVLVGREVGGAVEQLVGAFTLAFAMLARCTTPGRRTCPPPTYCRIWRCERNRSVPADRTTWTRRPRRGRPGSGRLVCWPSGPTCSVFP